MNIDHLSNTFKAVILKKIHPQICDFQISILHNTAVTLYCDSDTHTHVILCILVIM